MNRVRRLAKRRFGYDQLRPGQDETIRLALSGHDTLAVMPTGHGKSAIYQIAALFLPGTTVVVSPLIALQKDQVESLQARGVADAAVINSTVKSGEAEDAFDEFENGALEFLFLSPEQLANADVRERLKQSPPSLFVVDEAHCISEWGHDFRPDFMKLGQIIEQLGSPRIIALTATASPQVRDEIVERLRMKEPKVVVFGFLRDNLDLSVEACPDVPTKNRVLLARVQDLPKPGIVYVATRQHAEDVAVMLRENGVNAEHYHGGMKADERAKMQDAFMGGRVPVIVATNAFGMGVDKPDVRFVIHYDVPESLDANYPEVGRAGRDGGPATCILLYRVADVGVRRAMASGGKLSADEAEKVAFELQQANEPVAIEEIAQRLDLPESKVRHAVTRLEESKATHRTDLDAVAPLDDSHDANALAQDAAEAHEKHRQFRLSRVELMKQFAETERCRWRTILDYFGDAEGAERCGHCDNCRVTRPTSTTSSTTATDPSTAPGPWPVQARVTHRKFGGGTVLRYDGGKVVILFDTEGTRELVTRVVQENGLIETSPLPSSTAAV
jgi:ATP-dependent DNA helicase RecQ